jgi:hypothetical protein
MKYIKVLFLDIDGVIRKYPELEYDLDKINMIKQIVSSTGCKIVLSSTLRHQPGYLNFLRDNFDIDIMDKTPWVLGGTRSAEIQAWLDNTDKNVVKYAVVDDIEEAGPGHAFFKTESMNGINLKIAYDIIDHLGLLR